MPVVKRAGKSRLRASCDRCHQAKLRCTFDDPTACARCKKQHMPCVRSLSMPLGRTSGSRNKRKPSVSDYPTPKEFKTSPSFAGSTPPQYAADGPEAPPPVDSAPAWEDAFLDLDPTPFDLDPRFGALGLGWSDAHMLTALPDPDPATPDPPPRPDSFFSHALAGCDAHAAAARSATEPPPCSCLSDITTTTESLHQHAAAAQQTVDSLLCRNKAALLTLAAFLSCRQAHSEVSLILLVYLLLQKVLAAYAEAWFTGCSAAAAAALHNILRSREPALCFGAYTIDHDDGEALKQRLIFLEVQKVAPLLDRLEQRVWAGAAEAGGATRRTCLALQRFLRREAENLVEQLAEAS
ncbi:hypothetical protein MPH_03093 [Macrophomina phaseolina MS6]|uniref:Zn(2)-C6 fungal-type domain-containing protein n=1 Tax=Macrophomina phaseolina (strain MS6) TaxID=1126212 RepID=K2S3M8_MACPH|nr:hypothetical protein MPH_03093 [Macrophomina phaseolina MS6]